MNRSTTIFITLGVTLLALPVFAAAQTFVPLSPNLPVISSGKIGQGDMVELLNAFLSIAVVVAAVLAVVMVAIGGFQYMTTDSMFAMGSAKERISNAIIGLLIVLMSILILQTINPQLVNMDLFTPGVYGTTGAAGP